MTPANRKIAATGVTGVLLLAGGIYFSLPTGVHLHGYNLHTDAHENINCVPATDYNDAIHKFAVAEEANRVVYLRLRREAGQGVSDVWTGYSDGSGCPPGNVKISRILTGGYEAATTSISRDGHRVAYEWGWTSAGDWQIDLVDFSGANRRQVPLGNMVAARVPVPEFSCDGSWLKFSAAPNGLPNQEWYVWTGMSGAPIQIIDGDWPGACPWLFKDGFERGDMSRWSEAV